MVQPPFFVGSYVLIYCGAIFLGVGVSLLGLIVAILF